MEKINHSNICKILETIIEGGNIYLVLEYCGKINLRQLCDGFCLSLKQVKDIFRQLTLSIAYMHES